LKASVFFIITTIFWGLNYHWGKAVVSEVTPYEGAFWRYVIAVAVLCLLTITNLPTKDTLRKNWKGILKIGGLGLVGFNFFFFKGMEVTTPVNAALIVGLNPALTLILSSIILKTSISIKQIVGILVALLGVLYLLFEGNMAALLSLQFKLGDGLILLACFFFALHHVWVKKYSNPSISNPQLSLLAAAACLLFFIVLIGGQLLFSSSHSLFVDVASYSSTFWINALGIGALGTGVAYWFWYQGIDIAGADKAVVFVNIVPLSAAIAYVIKGSQLESFHIISGLIIVGGILVMQVGGRKMVLVE
jgi:drug/metabolite transporter (DMT)-like permease